MDYSWTNAGLWNPIIQVAIIAGAILLANIIRRKVAVIRSTLIPTAVLAGFILLILKIIGFVKVDVDYFSMITYHCIAIGFIALCLRVPEGAGEGDNRVKPFRSGCIIVGSYMIQGIVGLVITIGLALTFMPNLFHGAGVLLPMGFGQGPGQANNVGVTYEALGFAGGQSFGLSIAAAGYLCACTVGVFIINYLQKKGKLTRMSHEEISGSVTVDTFQGKDEVPISESLDKASIQVALILVAYGITYIIAFLITKGCSALSEGVAATLNPLVWGFNFMIGAGVAIGIREIMKHFRRFKIMGHQYQNNYLLSRISGLAFDIMITAGIATISIEQLKGLWVPFILLVIAGAVVTLLHLMFTCKRAYGEYYYEGLVSMYGMMTGTISSGVLLLRELDPMFKTPAANNMIGGSGFAIMLAIPLLIFVGIAPKSILAGIMTIAFLIVYYIVLVALAVRKEKNK